MYGYPRIEILFFSVLLKSHEKLFENGLVISIPAFYKTETFPTT